MAAAASVSTSDSHWLRVQTLFSATNNKRHCASFASTCHPLTDGNGTQSGRKGAIHKNKNTDSRTEGANSRVKNRKRDEEKGTKEPDEERGGGRGVRGRGNGNVSTSRCWSA